MDKANQDSVRYTCCPLAMKFLEQLWRHSMWSAAFSHSVFLVVIVAVVSLGACATNSQFVDQSHDEAELRKLKKVTWRRLYDNSDADGLDKFLAEDFVLIGGEAGFVPKIDEVEWLRNNEWEGPDDFVYTIENIVFLNRDAAIIYGVGTSTRKTENGVPCKHSYISSNTLRREGSVWRPVTSHVSDSRCDPITN